MSSRAATVEQRPWLEDVVADAPAFGPQALPTHAASVEVHDPNHHYLIAKIGLWLILATEVMVFGGLFCLYAVFRSGNPEAFIYGRQFLDAGWGTINTVVLILSSLTMAMAVYSAQVRARTPLMLFLALTIMCGVMFVGVKVIEYREKAHEGLLWGGRFSPVVLGDLSSMLPAGPTGGMGAVAAAPAAPAGPNIEAGKKLYTTNCAGCHGMAGEGMAQLGLPLNDSALVRDSSLADLTAFIRKGRMPGEPGSRMNAVMPPRGGNAFLTEADLTNIAAYTHAIAGADGKDGAAATALAGTVDFEALIPRWSISSPPAIFSALKLAPVLPPVPQDHLPSHMRQPPEDADQFFSMYFLLTGLHGIHVVIGISLVGWLLYRSASGHFDGGHCAPVEMSGLYWHLISVVWIVLFPLLYLIR